MNFHHEATMKPIRDHIAAAKNGLDDLLESYRAMPVPFDAEHERRRLELHTKVNKALDNARACMMGRVSAYNDHLRGNEDPNFSPAPPADAFNTGASGQADVFPRDATAPIMALTDNQKQQVDDAAKQAAEWKKQELVARGHYD